MVVGSEHGQHPNAPIWRGVKRATTFLAMFGVGVALTLYLILNGARPPVDPLSWPSWTKWWIQDPRSAVSLIGTSAVGVFGFVGTYFQIFLSGQNRETEKRTLARIEAGEDAVKTTVVADGAATRQTFDGLDAQVRRALERLESQGDLALARAAGLKDGQLLAIAQSLGFANVPVESWGAELLKAPNRLAAAKEDQSAAVKAAIDGGRFEDADRLLSAIEESSVDAAARSAAGLGALRLAQARFVEAAEHYSRAATLILGIDREKAWRCRFAEAFALAEYGRLFPGLEKLRRAVVVLWEQALPLAPREIAPVDWAMTQTNLGSVLTSLGERAGGAAGIEALNEAVTFFRLALEVRTREAMPIEWAKTQINLGDALRVLGELSGGPTGIEALNEAVAACRAALEVFTPEMTGADWAIAQNGLGNALHMLGELADGDARIEALRGAAVAYLAVLDVYTLANQPVPWAMTQNNLGIVLTTFGRLAGGPLGIKAFQEAVVAHCAALQVYSRQDTPNDWAMSHNNLGIALRSLGELAGGPAEIPALEEAEVAFRAALEVCTREDTPAAWLTAQNNLAATLQLLEERRRGTGGAL